MTWLNHLAAPAPILWQALAEATLLLALAALIVRGLPTARTRAALLHAALMLSLACPLLSASLPHYVVPASTAPRWSPFTEPPLSQAGAAAQTLRTLAVLLTLVWAAGAAFHLVRMAYGWRTVARLLRFAEPHDSPRLRRLLNLIDPHLQIRVLMLPGTGGAFCWQTHRPLLVLSPSVLELPDAELELLLRHEVAHLRSGDSLRLLLDQLAAAAYWFHPLVRWTAGETARWRELACDDWVISTGGSPQDYAGLLTTIATQRATPSPSHAALSFKGTPSHLIERVRRLTGRSPAPHALRATQSLAWAGLVASTFLLALGRFAEPQPGLARHDWTAWPKPTARLLNTFGLKVIDYDLRRFARDPREQLPSHRLAHDRRTQGSHSTNSPGY